MSNLIEQVQSLLTKGAFFLAMPSISKFTDTDSSITKTIIVVIIIFIIIYILYLIALYKLTNSGFQVFLGFLFGFFYLIIAIMYWGFSGYKLVQK